jgi:hypothetical protein
MWHSFTKLESNHACVNELMQNILPEVSKDVVSFDWLALRKCEEHGVAVLRHGDDDAFVGHLELLVAADEACLVTVTP